MRAHARMDLITPVVLVIGSTLAGCGGDNPIGLKQADELVIADVLPTEVPETGDWVASRLIDALPAGTIITEQPDELRAVARLTLDEPSYLYVLDLAPGSLQRHPVRFLTVGESGTHAIHDAESSPVIGGQAHDELLESPARPELQLRAGATWGALEAVEPSIVIPALELRPVDQQIIIVNGSTVHEGSAGNGYVQAWQTYRALVQFWTNYGLRDSGVTVHAMENSTGQDVLDAIDAAATAGKDAITLTVVSPYGMPAAAQTAAGFLMLTSVRDRVRAHPAVRFSVVLAFSGASTWVQLLAAEPNVEVALTAISNTGQVMADWDWYNNTVDHDPTDYGLEFPSAWLAAASVYTASAQAFTPVRTLAITHSAGSVPALLCLAADGAIGQRPQDGLGEDLDLSRRLGKAAWMIHCPLFAP